MLKEKYYRKIHNFGIQVPKTFDKAYKIEKKTGTNFLTTAIEKVMDIVHVDLEV